MLKAHVIEITKAYIAVYMKARIPKLFDVEKGKKQKIVIFFFFKALAKNFVLTWKCYSWPIFYQMAFMKR